MSATVDLDNRPPLTFYLSVGLVAGSIIALQIGIMRVFSVGSWAHFGSLVVSLAMFGFGLMSAVMCVAKGWFERHWQGAIKTALLLFGMVLSGIAPSESCRRKLCWSAWLRSFVASRTDQPGFRRAMTSTHAELYSEINDPKANMSGGFASSGTNTAGVNCDIPTHRRGATPAIR